MCLLEISQHYCCFIIIITIIWWTTLGVFSVRHIIIFLYYDTFLYNVNLIYIWAMVLNLHLMSTG